jgi:hypothetical protein
LRCGLKQSCSPHQKIPNGMSHAICTLGNQGDFWLLVVGSQIVNLTPDPSFGHNLCLKCSNESCELILDIYVPRAFQWYKDYFNPMNFDLCNHFLKIQKSIRTPTLKMGAHLGVWVFIPSHSLTLPWAWGVTPRLSSWPAPLQALALVTSLSLGLWHLWQKYIFRFVNWSLYLDLVTWLLTHMYNFFKKCIFIFSNGLLELKAWIGRLIGMKKDWDFDIDYHFKPFIGSQYMI